MRRGFTLIELLAVIVILAIIALIAVPIVVNIINDSKKESINRSIELYMDHVQKMVAKEQIKDPTFNPSECDIKPKGILECKNETKTYNLIQIEMKGQMPKTGKIKFSKGKIVKGVNLELDNLFYQVKDDKVRDVTTEKVVSYSDYIKSEEDTGEQGLSVGDKYEYEVSPGITRTFYVLSIEGDKVNLIMDRNICADGTPASSSNQCNYAWHTGEDNNNYGPDTAMTNLYNATKDWTNVPDMIMDYEDENNKTDNTKGYTGITTNNGVATITGKNGATNTTIGTIELPLKARLPKESEVTSQDAGCHVLSSNNDYGTCPTWLVENLVYYNVSSYEGSENTDKYLMNNGNGITNIYGYWLLSSYPGYSNYTRILYNRGYVYSDHRTSNANVIGLRAVITVSKSDLSN